MPICELTLKALGPKKSGLYLVLELTSTGRGSLPFHSNACWPWLATLQKGTCESLGRKTGTKAPRGEPVQSVGQFIKSDFAPPTVFADEEAHRSRGEVAAKFVG